MTAAGLGSSLVVDALLHHGAMVTNTDYVRAPYPDRPCMVPCSTLHIGVVLCVVLCVCVSE